MNPVRVKILKEGAKLPTYGSVQAAGADESAGGLAVDAHLHVIPGGIVVEAGQPGDLGSGLQGRDGRTGAGRIIGQGALFQHSSRIIGEVQVRSKGTPPRMLPAST